MNDQLNALASRLLVQPEIAAGQISGVTTLFQSTALGTHAMDALAQDLPDNRFWLDQVTLALTGISPGTTPPTTVHVKLTYDAAGDRPATGVHSAGVDIGETTSTKAGAVLDLDRPVRIPSDAGGAGLYAWVRFSGGEPTESANVGVYALHRTRPRGLGSD